MSELLAPAGNYEAFLAAVSNGCDAVYLACEKFGARAYAQNFNYVDLEKAINYAHLRNVKIYVTMNTIVFDSELEDAYSQIDELYALNVDGLIIQDLALIDYVAKKYPLLEAHASTQMGIDDKYGVMFCKEIGVKRTVLGRETPIETIINIKKEINMPIEIFVHGALCVSFSGNCLMSGLIGYRSGNRGRCVGSCRKKYKLINKTTNTVISDSYVLSMKDLNTTAHIKELIVADSLKIEGRMKEPYYVANIIKNYRELMDGNANLDDVNNNLSKTFNRTFTKGYIFGCDKGDMSNTIRPNHVGFPIGFISKKKGNRYEITLHDTLNQNDAIRITSSLDEANLSVVKMYDKDDNLINSANNVCYIDLKEKLEINNVVYKTKDVKYIDTLTKSYPKEFKRFPISIFLSGKIDELLVLSISYMDTYISITSEYVIQKAKKPFDRDKLFEQLNRLNDTPYFLEDLELSIDSDSFIPNSILNDLRRKGIDELNSKRLEKRPISNENYTINKISFPEEKPMISCFCNTKEQYQACLDNNIDIIYYDKNVFRRNRVTYKNIDDNKYILVGGYGGVNYFKGKNVISDFSLNVVNAKATNILHNMGVKRITLSHEINKQEINDLVSSYFKDNDGYPNLEMIVYGRQDLMHTFYCPLKVNGLCGKCKNNQYAISEEYGEFPIISHQDCTTTILNGKILNLIDEMNNIKHINVFRLQFTLENYEDTDKIIKLAMNKLNNKVQTKCFDESINTRGHFNKEIL